MQSTGYNTMPETTEEMDGFFECYQICSGNDPVYSSTMSNDQIWESVDMNICCEVSARLLDKELYFIDKYLVRFDKFMWLAFMEKYAEMVAPLFHRPPYNMGLIDHLWGTICDVSREDSDIAPSLIFRVVKGLDTSLRRVPIYVRDYVEHNASLLWCYEHIIANPDFGPGSSAYHVISTEVEKMLTEGVTLETK